LGAPSQRPHSFAAKAERLGKSEGGLWRRVIAGQKPTCIAGRGTPTTISDVRGRRVWQVASPLAALAVAVLAGCSNGNEDARTGDPFVERGNQICRELGRKLDELGEAPRPVGGPAFRRHEKRAVTVSQEAFVALQGLEPPPELEQARNQFFVAVTIQRRHSRELERAARAAQRETRQGREGPAGNELSRLVDLLREDTQRAQARLRELGWTECIDPGA
jgi:hypothetical protein